MDIVLVLPFVPKLALTLLIITGILIVIEVYNIIKEGKPQAPTPVATPKTTMEPLVFSSTPPPAAPIPPPSPLRSKRIKLIIPLIAVALISAVVIAISIFNRTQDTIEQTDNEPRQPSKTNLSPIPTLPPEASPTAVLLGPNESSPSATPTQKKTATDSAMIAPPIIKLYSIDKNKKWVQLSTDALAKLNAGDEIKIAVATEKPYVKALFNVNNEEILYVKDQQLNPFKEGYITYVIKEGVTNYTIEVFLLE